MNKMESSPGEQMHTSDVPLSLDTDQRLNLLHDLRGLSAELQENPFISPDKRKLALKGIALHSSDKTAPPTYMRLEMAHASNQPSSAAILLSGNQAARVEPRIYLHRPSIDVWEEWRPGATAPLKMMDNTRLVEMLEPILPNGTVESFMDANPTGTEVVSQLATRLRKKARTHTEYSQYSAHGIEVGSPEYTRDTDFIIRTINDRVIRSLYVAASFMLDDYGHLRKTYSFETDDSRGSIKSANGSIRMSATGDVPKTRLNAFAQRDQIRNDPSIGLVLGINDIRKTYLS